MQRLILAFLIGFFLSSCGYRCSNRGSSDQVMTFNVPYIKGDSDGKLTACMIKELSMSANWQYNQIRPEYLLDVEIIKHENNHIGYRYDRVESTGRLIDRLIPIEGRKKIVVRCQLLDRNKQVVQGPYEIEASGDYDFVNFDTYKDLAFVDIQGQSQSVLTYSLGQLDALDGAQDSVFSVVYQQLVKKIVLSLENL